MSRTTRLDALKKAADEYFAKEKKRIENEVSVLKGILSGRTGGQGIKTFNVNKVASVARNEVQEFLGE